MNLIQFIQILFYAFIFLNCAQDKSQKPLSSNKNALIPVIIDTDANNEIDDQHALAYLFFNSDHFDVLGVTVNATYSGGAIENHMAEAERVMKLCNVHGSIPLLEGANDSFEEIVDSLNKSNYDGSSAVDFIIEKARETRQQRLVLIPIGKLTNIALALSKAPDIEDKIKIVWLGANYPEPGEYNLENDIPSMNFILNRDVPFEVVTVRYGQPSGSDAVRATPEDIQRNLEGAGPEVNPVEGRHGGTFTNFGNYALNLFQKIDLHGDPPSRALFDVVAVAILKNPEWGTSITIPAPIMKDKKWQDRQSNKRNIVVWENFDEDAILKDFYSTLSSK